MAWLCCKKEFELCCQIYNPSHYSFHGSKIGKWLKMCSYNVSKAKNLFVFHMYMFNLLVRILSLICTKFDLLTNYNTCKASVCFKQTMSLVNCTNGDNWVHFQTDGFSKEVVWRVKERKLEWKVQTSPTFTPPHTWPITAWSGHDCWIVCFRKALANTVCSNSDIEKRVSDASDAVKTIKQALCWKHTEAFNQSVRAYF